MTQGQMAKAQTVERPALTPRPGSLLDVATTPSAEDGWLVQAEAMWDTVNCADLNTEYALACDVDPEGEPVEKTFDGITWVDGFRFAAYKGTSCKAPGLISNSQFETFKKLNTDAFLANESASVEVVFGTHVLADITSRDLTPGSGAVTLKQGLALLEGHAGSHYAGVPTIHASTQIFSLLDSEGASLRKTEGNGFRTMAGSKLVNGGGYYDLTATEEVDEELVDITLAANERWLFATGEVVIVGSKDINVVEMERTTNEVFALTERIYVAAHDCYSVAVKVKVF